MILTNHGKMSKFINFIKKFKKKTMTIYNDSTFIYIAILFNLLCLIKYG